MDEYEKFKEICRLGKEQMMLRERKKEEEKNNIDLETDNMKYVYFIQASRLKYIKIGISNNPKQRLKELQSNELDTLELLLYTIGGRKIEHFLHKTFEEDNIKGEWFKPTDEILNLIEKLKPLEKQRRKIEKNILEIFNNYDEI